MTNPDQPTPTLADTFVAYAQAGWPCILPVPALDKTPPPPGFTGAEGRDTDPLQLVAWAGDERLAGFSVALRMPDGVIGIDVDQYVKKGKQKHGALTLAALLERLGPLPPTWSSTARGTEAGPGESRILLFRAPAQRYSTRLTATHPDGSTTGDIEIIQRHHRYAVVWPSPHGDSTRCYTWYDPAGLASDAPPKPSELAELPPSWVAALAEGAAQSSPASADRGSGQHLLDQLEADDRMECSDVTSARLQAAHALSAADEGSRHDGMTERVYHLVQLGAAGHPGVGAAIGVVRAAWETLTAGEDRAEELERALLTAARKAATVVGGNQVPRDPCLLMAGGIPLPAAPPGDTTELPDGTEVQMHAPPRWASAREILGAHAFDPNAGMDQTLAERVLERIYPALRYAYDSKGWLLRVPERWELHGKLSGWAVASVASLMPVGDPTAEKGSDQFDRSARRARLMSTAGARAVAGKMEDLVAGGLHPAAVALADLDSDPEVLWAGGMPWSLRASSEVPTPAQLDPSTPHLHTAAVAPQRVPTPLWDNFLDAVWPDPSLRTWAVRVLSITLTGYADRALPILLGETGRGKALDVDTPLLTTHGWTTMGEVQPGAAVYGPDGQPTTVLGAFDVIHDHQCYRVTAEDGRTVVADAEHLWTVTRTADGNRVSTVTLTTQEMVDAGLTTARGRAKFHLPRTAALQTPNIPLPIEPYLLGAWLGDGNTGGAMLTVGVEDIDDMSRILESAGARLSNVRRAGTSWRVSFETPEEGRGAFSAHARAMGVLDNKHVPAGYLTAGTEQRLALLQGLLDTDGSIDPDGRVEFTNTKKSLADAVLYLARSLGWSARLYAGRATLNGRDVGPKWRVYLTPRSSDPYCPFRLGRKADRVSDKPRSDRGTIASIEPVDSRPVRCIKVAREDGLFLAGEGLMPTHNTQVVALLMSVLGSYAHAANPKLLSPTANEHDTIVFDLKGRRCSFIDEAPSEAKAGQERLKQLTGGGELTGRRMNQDPITFAPSHTFVLTANDEPALTDPAVRSRVRLIPCEGDPEAVRRSRAAIGHISGRAWRAEAPGVLAAMMAEAAGWLADPTTAHVTAAPEGVRYLAEHLGAEQDPVTVWVTEETEPYEQGTPSRELYQAFTGSCLRNNLRRDAIPTESKWGRTLGRLGYPSEHTRTGKVRRLRVRPSGFLPGMEPVTGLDVATRHVLPVEHATAPESENRDGLGGSRDGLVTGSDPQPVTEFSQVNPTESVDGDGCDGLEDLFYACAPAPAHRESDSENPPNPSHDPSESEPPKPKPKRATKPRSAEATAKAAQLRGEKRAAAIAEAAGPTVQLPAVVTRDGTLRPCSAADADAMLATITEAELSELTVDVEHTGYPIGHADYALRSVQLGDEHLAVDLDPDDPEQADVVRRHLAAAAVLHAHSATADLIPLAHAGLADEDELWAKMVDTAILAKLADPSSTDNSADLKSLSKAVLGDAAVSPDADEARKALFKAGKWLTDTEVTTPLERSGWAQVDPSSTTMVIYATSDVLDDAALARRLPKPAPQVLRRERTVQRMTARMASTGFRFDPDQVERLTAEHTAARATHAERVRGYGIDNPGSAAQVGAAFTTLGVTLPPTGTGKPSVAAGVLEPLRDLEGEAGDLARAVLDYRHHSTALGLFLEPWGDMVRRGDGRARSTIYTLGADTGRMSSVRFNFQQISREGGLRGCITADPGWLLASADFAGVELRVGAALSGDRNLIEILGDPNRDLHMEIARLVWGPNATKAERYKAKPMVFGRIYGSGVNGLALSNGVSHMVAQAVIDAMDMLTPGLSEWSRMVRDGIEAGRTQFPTAGGRVIHLPKRAPHAGPNYCIQGTAREILVDALLRWRETRWGDCVILPVHDELVPMVPEDEAEEATAALVECMTTELAGVPIIAEPSQPSYAWSDAA